MGRKKTFNKGYIISIKCREQTTKVVETEHIKNKKNDERDTQCKNTKRTDY